MNVELRLRLVQEVSVCVLLSSRPGTRLHGGDGQLAWVWNGVVAVFVEDNESTTSELSRSRAERREIRGAK